jgi:hypothetical protein
VTRASFIEVTRRRASDSISHLKNHALKSHFIPMLDKVLTLQIIKHSYFNREHTSILLYDSNLRINLHLKVTLRKKSQFKITVQITVPITPHYHTAHGTYFICIQTWQRQA